MKTVHIIAGPTAGGKSALALARALECGGEIINADSRQIYNVLPILSAQPAPEDKQTVPHHLYGALNPNDICSAGKWLDMALPLIAGLLDKGVTPIVTGGTGLYIKALTEGLSPIPRVPPDIRNAAIALHEKVGSAELHTLLAARDPETAALYHPNHSARLIHAWEVLEATGKGFAAWQALPRVAPPADWMFDLTLVIPPRERLYERCNLRFLQMMESGGPEEAETFDETVAAGKIDPLSPVLNTIGLAPLRAFRSGTMTKSDAITRAQTDTRNYAKRQMTWFRNQMKNIDIINKVL